MIGETKAATDGAGSAEWRAAADCRGLMNLAGRSAAPGPGCQVARQEELLPSPGLILVIIQHYSSVPGTSVSALLFPYSTWDQKLKENLATAKQDGKWSDYSVVSGREGLRLACGAQPGVLSRGTSQGSRPAPQVSMRRSTQR